MSIQASRRPITFYVPTAMHEALAAAARAEGESASTILRRLLSENLPGLKGQRRDV